MSAARRNRQPKARALPRSITAARAIAAAEVLEAVWLHDLELDHEVDSPPIVGIDKHGGPWVTVRILVPQLDVDMWEDGTHCDHPDNKRTDDTMEVAASGGSR